MAWDQASVTDFLRGPLLSSWPGRIVVVLMLLPFFLGILCWLAPGMTERHLFLAWGPALMLWPLMIFIQFVKLCDSNALGGRWEWVMLPLVAFFPFVSPYVQLYLKSTW